MKKLSQWENDLLNCDLEAVEVLEALDEEVYQNREVYQTHTSSREIQDKCHQKGGANAITASSPPSKLVT